MTAAVTAPLRVAVIGSGIAGLVAAIEAARIGHHVTLVTKSQLRESNTWYAQGGVAVALFPDDSIESHVQDTLVAGAGLNDRRAVHVLCSEGPDRIRQLIDLGVAFDTEPTGALARGHEAAHSSRRVLHAGGDATGAVIERGLLAALKATGVTVLEHRFMTDIVLDDDHVAGVAVVDDYGVTTTLEADAVVLASGGACRLYAHTTNPVVTTGDGAAAAWRAGAVLTDAEFVQFHPTSLAVPGNFLISEAVRGEGAVLRDRDGERFMLAVHPDGELAPRDVVARGIAEQMAKQGGQPVWLDATMHSADYLAERFPTIDATVRRHGFDWANEYLPVTPAAHYWMGGVRTDEWGRTSIPGLFAVGEVACTRVHGANRLASNSLLESLVFAWRAVEQLGRPWEVDDSDRDDATAVHAGDVVALADATPVESVGEVPFSREALQALNWRLLGLHRDEAGLRQAQAQLDAWHASLPQPTKPEAWEDANLLDLSRVVAAAALARRESRGAHARLDYPDLDPQAATHTNIRRKVPTLVVAH